MGVELDDDELQTTPRAAAKALAGRRVLALTMAAIVEDLEGVELVGELAEAVLFGGADETPETNSVFSYMNLARAFAEIDAGAELYCLHKNPWWQTARGPMLDSGAFVAGLEYATGVEATVLGKPSPAYFLAALEARRRRARADVDGRRRHRGRHHRRAGARDEDGARPHRQVPARRRRALAGHARRDPQLARRSAGVARATAVKVGVDLIEIARIGRRSSATRASASAASPRRSARTATRARIPRRATRAASPARRRSARRSGSASASPGRRSRSSGGRSRASGSRAGRGPRAERLGSGDIDLSMTHSRELAAAICVVADVDAPAALHRRGDARGRGRATTSRS